MSKRPRRNHSPAFKAKVTLAAVTVEKTLAELAQQYDVHPNPIDRWRSRLPEGAAHIFGAGTLVLPGAVPGEGTTMGAMSLVKGDLPPRTVHAGCPACYVRDRDRDGVMDAERRFRAAGSGTPPCPSSPAAPRFYDRASSAEDSARWNSASIHPVACTNSIGS